MESEIDVKDMDTATNTAMKQAKRVKVRNCSVPTCDTKLAKSSGTFFTFPKGPVEKAKWLTALKMVSHSACDLICYKHFKLSDYAKGTGQQKRIR